MVEIADIDNRDSLGAWLNEQPEVLRLHISLAIAFRAAARVVPVYWSWTAGRVTALPILRCVLISAVAAEIPSVEISGAAAAAAASAAVDASTDTDVPYPVAAADAAASAAASAAATAAAASSAAADASASAASAASAAFAAYLFAAAARAAASNSWAALRDDCGNLSKQGAPQENALWGGRENPLEEAWKTVIDTVSEPEWFFWVDWYQGMLDGRPQNWPLLERIALIEPAVWDGGAASCGTSN